MVGHDLDGDGLPPLVIAHLIDDFQESSVHTTDEYWASILRAPDEMSGHPVLGSATSPIFFRHSYILP